MHNTTATLLYNTTNPLLRDTREQTLEECWNELIELQHDFARLQLVSLVEIIFAIQHLLANKKQFANDIVISSITSLVWKTRNSVTFFVNHKNVDKIVLTRVADLSMALNIALGDHLTLQ